LSAEDFIAAAQMDGWCGGAAVCGGRMNTRDDKSRCRCAGINSVAAPSASEKND